MYKDTTGYFGIYFNKPSWWIMRVSIEGRKNWIGFNLDDTAAAPMIPSGVAKLDPHPHAAFRVQVSSVDEIPRLEPIVAAAFEKAIADRGKASIVQAE